MIRLLVLFGLNLVTALSVLSATMPLYINNAPVNAPPDPPPVIDATAFANRSMFHVDGVYFSGLPYQTANTRYFTNASSAAMTGNPGFRFDYSSGNTRLPMYNWVNQGSINGDVFLLVSSDNITSTGPLSTSDRGLIRLTGGNINLNRNGLRAGGGATNSISGFNLSDTNYFDPVGVTDFYWGVGSNNVLTGNGTLTAVPGTFALPFPSTPVHRVNFPGSGTAFQESFFVQNAGAFAYTSQSSSTSRVVQVVFVPTNSFFDSNISTRVFFSPDADDGATAVVEISYPEYDVVNQAYTTNFVYFADSTAFATNLATAKNEIALNTRRPNSYELIRYSSGTGARLGFFGVELPPNTPYTPDLLYNAAFASNTVGVTYAAYGAQFEAISVLNGSGQNVAATTDPTNYAGRVEITGDTVNLDLARIRAESTVIIKANELTSNKVAKISAPYENLDLRTSQPEMVISNFAPSTVQRLVGSLQAYSATWRNYERTPAGTNTVDFHVLLLQHSFVSTLPTIINELALHAPRLVIGDPLGVRKTMVLDTRNLEVTGGLTLPSGVNWANNNIVEAYVLTNRGIINVSGSALVGSDRANPYDYYFNSGTNAAASHTIRARNLDNRGCLVANSGVITIDATRASIAGAPLSTNFPLVPVPIFFGTATNLFGFQQITNIVGAKLQANADIHITADQLTFSNALIQTGPSGGALFLSPVTSLTDGGQGGISYWNVSGGFNLLTRPATSSLLGTYVTTKTPRNSESFHTWSGLDRGATAAGYNNNGALGKLTIDAGQFSLVHFAGPNGQTGKAIYVDYLELLNYADTNVNTQIAIDPSIKIYFANANLLPSKLDGAAGNRLRWVPSFTGPLSSTNITYPDGTVYTLNLAVATDWDLDSDRDGVTNNEDPTPVYNRSSIGLEISHGSTAGEVLIQWNAFPGVANTVQYCNSITDPGWTTLRTVVPEGPFSGPYSITDSPSGSERIYRVLVNAPSQ